MTKYWISDIMGTSPTLQIGFGMATTKILISLSQDLATRLRSAIPHKERSKVIQTLIETEVKKRENQLYEAALRVEQDTKLKKEMQLWEVTEGDGLS